MPLNNSVIQNLRRIAGNPNVLTALEDLYVYSFEQFFRQKQYPQLEAAVRVVAKEQIREVEELAEAHSMKVAVRSVWRKELNQQSEAPIILIDDVQKPELAIIDKDKREERLSSLQKQLEVGGYGSFRNFALALNSFLSELPAQKCLNCSVCTGYCTVSSAFNGVETWSSKGRTILTQALFSNDLKPSPKMADVMYSCSLCGLCFAECFETTQVRKAIMKARHRLAEKGHTPELFRSTAKNIAEVGDPSGMPPSKRATWTQQLKQRGSFPEKANVLLWSGCIVSTRTPNAAKALGNILNLADVAFAFLGEKEGCCGYVLLAIGLWDEARENAARLIERVRNTRAETLITPCAGCYYTFTKMYPEILEVDMPCRVMHASQYVEKLINERRITLKNSDSKITYHDPCSLGRHCSVYSSPRNVLKAVPNLDFVEMPLNRDRARCCGAGGGLWSYSNAVALNSASERLEKDAAHLGVSALVTACPTCHLNFRFAATKRQVGIKILDLMEIVESALAPAS